MKPKGWWKYCKIWTLNHGNDRKQFFKSQSTNLCLLLLFFLEKHIYCHTLLGIDKRKKIIEEIVGCSNNWPCLIQMGEIQQAKKKCTHMKNQDQLVQFTIICLTINRAKGITYMYCRRVMYLSTSVNDFMNQLIGNIFTNHPCRLHSAAVGIEHRWCLWAELSMRINRCLLIASWLVRRTAAPQVDLLPWRPPTAPGKDQASATRWASVGKLSLKISMAGNRTATQPA